MAKKRVHILSTVNAANVSKTDTGFLVRNVCGAVDGIVMNRMLYPGEQLAAGVDTLNHRPCPAGHPKNEAGQYISALHGDALLTAYAGAVCRNARHEGGRTLVDIVVNAAAAKAHPDGAKLVERLDAAITGNNVDPIHVSTGLLCEPITANGEAGGKGYDRIATNIRYDHLAFLLNERGAGTPEEGVGMFLNAAGQTEEVEAVALNTSPEDKRSAGLVGWLKRLIGNAGDISFDQITSGLHATLPDGAWVQEVFDRYAVWRDRDGKLMRQDYAVASDGSVAWSGTAQEVTRKVSYEPVTNHEVDHVKDKILAALNAAGISTAGKTDEQMLQDYDALRTSPLQTQLTAANSKVAGYEQAANAAADAELNTLATELAANSKALTAADFKAMGLARCKELKATAAPIVVGNAAAGSGPADEFAGYSLNVKEA
jgi:hypothetical protein